MNKPLFSCVLIARNESKVLPRLLKSLTEFKERGGETILVDTGSTDNTVEIAKKWGCIIESVGDRFKRVIDKEKADKINQHFLVNGEEDIFKEGDSCFDFASARNYAASLATNNYISYADADEEYTKLDIDKINDIISQGFGQFEYEFTFSHDQFGNPAVQFRQCKFYDKTKLHWTGRIHEVLSPIGDDHPAVTYLQPSIYKLDHWQNLETNRTGYLRGLALDCFEFPDNDRHSHYLARELYWSNRPHSAIREFNRHIAMDKWPAEKSQSMIFLGDIYDSLKDDKTAISWYHMAIEAEPNRREPWIHAAKMFFKKNDYMRTACYASAAVQIPWSDFYANQKSHYTFEPEEMLYWAKWWLGDKDESKIHFDKAIDFLPYYRKFQEDSKFYYEYPDSLIEGWMTFRECQWLYNNAKKYNKILEIGSWKGRSSHALLSGCKGQVTCVDTFEGSDDVNDLTNKIAKEEDIYSQFQKNVGHFKNLIVLRMTSEEAHQILKDEKFDLIFLDALHTEDGVIKDIELWKNNATRVICGHDYSAAWPGVVSGVDKTLGKPDIVSESIWQKYII